MKSYNLIDKFEKIKKEKLSPCGVSYDEALKCGFNCDKWKACGNFIKSKLVEILEYHEKNSELLKK